MKLVLTGGPSGGKTTMALSIAKSFAHRVVIVPEAASILFTGGFLRRNYSQAIKLQQQAIYAVQVAQESIYEIENINHQHLIVCDRGTVDGLAYWPDEKKESFFNTVGSTHEKELARYDWVIHLDTAGAESYDKNNVIRIENHQEADALNQKIKNCWSLHPQRFVIPSTASFFKKVSIVMTIIEKILTRENYQKINKDIFLSGDPLGAD